MQLHKMPRRSFVENIFFVNQSQGRTIRIDPIFQEAGSFVISPIWPWLSRELERELRHLFIGA
jgi:hypothetical protein